MRKPINFLIADMAMSDLLYPIFLIPRQIQLLYVDSWLIGGPLGQALCKLATFLPYNSALVSIQSLVLIAVDRLAAVVFPLRSPLISSKRCAFCILATWIVAMAAFSPYLFAMKVSEYRGGLGCRTHWNEVFEESLYFESYLVAILVVFIFIPFVLVAILYSIILLKRKSHKIPDEQSANTEGQRWQRERNVLKMAIAILSGFAICWLPLIIRYLLFFFSPDIKISCGFQYFAAVAFFMVNKNCAVNPCICFIFSRNYLKGLKTLLR